MAAALATGHLHIAMLYGLAFLFGLAETLYDNTSSALVPSTVHDHDLERANGRLQATYTLANSFVGPPLGSGLIGLAIAAPFVLGSAGYAIALMLTLLLPTMYGKKTADAPASSFSADLREGIRGFTHSPMLVALCVLFTVGNLASAATYSLLSLTVVERLNVPAATYGFVLAGGAVGAALGGAFGARIGTLTRPGTTIVWTTLVSGLATAGLGLVDNVVALTALMAVDGFVVMVQSVITVSLRARLIPNHMLGRVTAVFRTLSMGAAAAGALLGGLLARTLGLSWPFVVAGAIVVLLAPALLPWLNNRRLAEAVPAKGSVDGAPTPPRSS